MDLLSGDGGLIFLFLFLLPGFLGSTAYSYLVEREKSDNYERVVQALTLTLVSTVVVHALTGLPILPTITINKDTPISSILLSTINERILYTSIIAVFIAAVFAILNNHGLIYWALRHVGLTYKTSNADVWQDTFYKYQRYWICVRFLDGTSLIGWPRYYSAIGKPREFFCCRCNVVAIRCERKFYSN